MNLKTVTTDQDSSDQGAEDPVFGHILVFDLVLYHGRLNENRKSGLCRHFVTYRNYYVPKVATNAIGEKENKALSTIGGIKNKVDAGRTTLEDILKEAQLLSGSFFSGEWNEDLLCEGSLFYFHRYFCLHFTRKGKDADSHLETSDGAASVPEVANAEGSSAGSPSDAVVQKDGGETQKITWLGGDVMYFDCSTGSHFEGEWTEEKYINGIWNLGCVGVSQDSSTNSHLNLSFKNFNFPGMGKSIPVKVQRLPKLTTHKQIRSSIIYGKKKKDETSEAEHIDVKDGERVEVSC
jgi:hypothetical protein